MSEKTEEMDMITVVVRRSLAEKAVHAAMESGASGVTYCSAFGTGVRQKLGYAGTLIESEKEILWIVTSRSDSAKVLAGVAAAANLSLPGEGFACVHSVTQAVGFIKS